uniref:Uncharacterized protein n=1 Tax=Mammaliicoccus phage MSShimriz1 TaxID=3230127 RepID=A0AAU8GTG3_9VIRU
MYCSYPRKVMSLITKINITSNARGLFILPDKLMYCTWSGRIVYLYYVT